MASSWFSDEDPPLRPPKPDGLIVARAAHAAKLERQEVESKMYAEVEEAREALANMPIRQIVLHRKHPHGDLWLAAFKHGLKRHGKKAIWSNRFEKSVDLAVLWGMSQHDLIMRYSAAKIPYLILECGFVADRLNYASCGYGGLNGRADFRNEGSPDDRAGFILRDMVPWRENGTGQYVLIMGQLQGDQATRGVNLKSWYADTAKYIANLGHHVAFRQHPLSRGEDCPRGAELLLGELPQALNRASCVVTYNSNSGVDAVLSGIPTIAIDQGSMVRPVSSRHLGDVVDPPRPDRTQWAQNLTYAQWREEEFRSGRVWEHLK